VYKLSALPEPLLLQVLVDKAVAPLSLLQMLRVQ
jgi:hypothetical protein